MLYSRSTRARRLTLAARRAQVAMLLSDLATVRAAHIILASGSPRRVEMLNAILKLEARVVPSTFPEDLDKSLFTPQTYVMENAKLKV